MNDFSFARDVDGPRHLATLFDQPCNPQEPGERLLLTFPGASIVYAGDLRLWQSTALGLLTANVPPNLNGAEDQVDLSWSTFLKFTAQSN